MRQSTRTVRRRSNVFRSGFAKLDNCGSVVQQMNMLGVVAGKKQQQAHTLRKPINYGGSKASIPAIDAILRFLGSPSRAKVTPKRLSSATKV